MTKADIALFGATGFAGRLTAEHLAKHLPDGASWIIAGRTAGKLEQLADDLQEDGGVRPEILVADIGDADSMRVLAESTRVLISTVGPYVRDGDPAVRAAVEAGITYLDLTGEAEFVDETYLKYQDSALTTGAKLVHSCGFDSIPYDLAVLLAVQHLPENVPVTARGYIRAGGSASGGTYHSAVNGFARVRNAAAAAKRRKAKEPRPSDRRVRGAGGKVVRGLDGKGWAVPLPTIDPQVVLRSARTLPRYGPDISYAHYAQFKKRRMVAATGAGLAVILAGAQLGPTRKLLLRAVDPGTGPSPEKRAKSWFKFVVVAEGGGVTARVTAKGGDPGYTETAVMLGESALCLAFDDVPDVRGQVTPAVAMGEKLLARLPYFEVETTP